MNLKLPSVKTNTPKCKLTLMNSGFYGTKLNMIKKGSPRKHIWGPAFWFIIEHPTHGTILFDTGYHSRYYEVTKKFPYNILNWILPVKIHKEEDAKQQLKKRGISPDDVTIILSHLHIDHTGGVCDFPNAPVYISKEEWELGQETDLQLLKKGYLKPLFSMLKQEQMKIVDFDQGKAYGPFNKSIDIFQDGSLILVPLFGHSVGQMGLILNCSESERYFLCVDAVYCKGNYEEIAYSSILTNVAHANVKQYHDLYNLLNKIWKANPDLEIIPSHDPDIYREHFGPLPR